MGADAASIKAGASYISMGLDDSLLQKGLDRVASRLKGFAGSIGAIGVAMGGVGAAIAGPMLAMAKEFSDAGSALNDMSVRTGLSVENLSALEHAAKLSGVEMEALEGAWHRYQRTLAAAQMGMPAAQAAFAELGLSVDKLAKLSPDKQFDVLAARIRAIKDPTARAAAAMMLFGKSGAMLLPLLNDWKELRKEAQRLGLIMTADDAAAADALGDAMDTATETFRRFRTMIGAAIAPALTQFAGLVSDGIAYVTRWVSEHRPLVDMVFKIGVGLVAAGAAFVTVGATLAGIGVAMAAVLNPVTLTVSALAGLTYWFLTSTKAGNAMVSWLIARFNELKDDALSVFEGISDAMSAGDLQLAGEILWAGLEVEWAKGLAFLKATLGKWVLDAVNAFEHWRFAAMKIANNLWADLQIGFLDTLDFLLDEWGPLWDSFKDLANKALEFVIEAFAQMASRIPELLAAGISGADVHSIAKAIQADLARAAREAKGAATAVSTAAAGRRFKTRDEIRKERDGRNANLDQREREQAEARQKWFEAMIRGDAEAVAAAQAKLDALKETAADERMNPGKKKDKPAPGEEDPFAGLDAALGDTAKKVDVHGSFSAVALQGMGIGDTLQEDQLKELKKANQELTNIRRNQETGGMLFGP